MGADRKMATEDTPGLSQNGGACLLSQLLPVPGEAQGSVAISTRWWL